MTQHALYEQETLPIQKKAPLSFSWMRYFFSNDASPAGRSLAEMQYRAVWIGIALILQSLNEIDHDYYMPLLQPFGSLIPFALLLGSFYAMWRAIRPRPKGRQDMDLPAQPRFWQRLTLVLTLILTIIGTVIFGYTVMMSILPPQLSNDGTSLDTNAAVLLTQGRNPYTDSNIPELLRRFDIQANWTTPLRQGQFANRLDYPSMAELQSVLNTSLKADDVPEFEAKVSYPALSFLTLLPFALIQNYNVLPFYLLCYLALVALAWKVARPELRPWVLLLSLANVPMWTSVLGGNLDVFYTLLVVLAWWLRDSRWSSAVFFGLALASKQIAWYFIPFYAIMVWRNYGFKEAMHRLSIAGALGLAINLPFILWNPHAWLAGVMAPIADPMFPMGVGLINLSATHLIPFLPTTVYTLLEAMVMLLALLCYWRISRKCPQAAMLLAILPLFVAWRSLPSYFYCAAFPVFIIMSARTQPFAQFGLLPVRLRRLLSAFGVQSAPARV